MKLNISNHAYYRNGIDGVPVAVVPSDEEGPTWSGSLAILFEEEHHGAVVDVQKLVAEGVAFPSKSRRGDRYEEPLRRAVKEWERRTCGVSC